MAARARRRVTTVCFVAAPAWHAINKFAPRRSLLHAHNRCIGHLVLPTAPPRTSPNSWDAPLRGFGVVSALRHYTVLSVAIAHWHTGLSLRRTARRRRQTGWFHLLRGRKRSYFRHGKAPNLPSCSSLFNIYALAVTFAYGYALFSNVPLTLCILRCGSFSCCSALIFRAVWTFTARFMLASLQHGMFHHYFLALRTVTFARSSLHRRHGPSPPGSRTWLSDAWFLTARHCGAAANNSLSAPLMYADYAAYYARGPLNVTCMVFRSRVHATAHGPREA